MKTLSFTERIKIETLLKQGIKPYKIADILHRSKQTIYNEIHRGTVTQNFKGFIDKDIYFADVGERIKKENFSRCGVDLKIGSDIKTLELIEKIVKEKHYSFFAALEWIRKNTNIKINLSVQTLYNYLEKGIFLNLTYEDLPEGQRKRKKKPQVPRPAWKNTDSKKIDDRSEEIETREAFGHWEGDTVYSGKESKDHTCLLVLTERKTRIEIMQKIKDRSAKSVNKAMRKIAKDFKDDIKSITFDNGSEFSGWRKIEKIFSAPVYFCHPYRSGERGSNEFNNRLIRRFIPKGSAIGDYTNNQIKDIETWINELPRKILAGNSAIECYKNIKFPDLLTN